MIGEILLLLVADAGSLAFLSIECGAARLSGS